MVLTWRVSLCGLALLALGGCAGMSGAGGTAVLAPPARPLAVTQDGRLEFSFSRGGAPVTLSGQLTLLPGRRRLGAAIVLHDCGGIAESERGWEAILQEWGYATFVVDSFGGRGLRDVCGDASALDPRDRVPDAYGALKLLVGHPRIDPDRLVLVGIGHGGTAAMHGAREAVGNPYVETIGQRYRAVFAMYPRCAGPLTRAISPVYLHVGILDDWAPAAACQQAVEALERTDASAAEDYEVIAYPGARHRFDAIGLPARVERPEADLGGGKRGATVGHSRSATEQVRSNVSHQISQTAGF